MSESKDINEALQGVHKAVTSAEKKAAKALDGASFLAAVEDWEEIFYFANAYTDKGVKKGKTEQRSYKDAYFGEYKLSIDTPKKYTAKKGPFPVVICIPPKGMKTKNHLLEDWTDTTARQEFIIVACDMPTNERLWSEAGTPENHGGIDTVLLSLKSLKKTHAVDVDRVYLAGFGEGVVAAARIAAFFPHVFAGVIGRAGDLDDLAPTNLRNLPTFFAGGGEKCTAFQKSAKEAGIENVTVNATATEADLWEWMRLHPRDANPMEVSLAPMAMKNTQVYWLNASGFDLDAKPTIHARIDRATNTIHIEGTGISSVTLFFNDLLVDLSAAVKVVCNGVENEDYIPQNLKTMIDMAYNNGDSGRVYVGSHTYDLPEKAEDK